MYVTAHELFKRFMAGLDAQPEASVVHSLAESPRLGDFLGVLDPNLSLDWSSKDFQGLPSLREKVLARTGTAKECIVEDVLITAGTAEANFLAISQLVQPGDEIIVDVPGWPQPLVLGDAIGATVKRLQRKENQAWRFDLNELSELITDRTKLIFLCNPNNPTGQVIHEEELKEIITLADKVGAYVLCDEVYAGLEWDGKTIPRVANLYDKGISTGSVSKVLGLQGLRTGWIVCRDKKLIYDAMVLREDTSEIMNIMGEAIADIALADDYYFKAIERALTAGRHNLGLVNTFIQSQAELEWHLPPAGLIGFCRLNYEMKSDAFAQGLMQMPFSTFVMPGSAYGYPEHLRLGFGGAADAGVAKGLARMQQFLKTLRIKS
ncbi:MAG: aspartate/methionine/tyrosine aminotransferase [Planctomycetota bacterium]|jgi:aspartate/methionine/tyrosine aminotransferase